MKTITLVLALSTFCFCASQAQDLPNDLTPISQPDAPVFATYYSIAYSPDFPALPWNGWDSSADLYYSPTYGTNYIWVDDRGKVAGRMLTESFDPPPIPGGDDAGPPDPGPPPPGPLDYGTNLWISLDSYTNAGDGMTYFFTIHNTTNGRPYEIISSTNVAAPMNPTNWYSEGVWLATSTNLAAYVPMGSKTNRNFFRAHLWTDFTYGVPTNGQVFMQSATNDIYPVVNGVTNHLMPFSSNWFVLNPRPTNIYALNLGYAAEDFGFTDRIVNTNPPQQILRFVGYSKTITNLCLSSNLLTTLNISGWPALQDIEAWHNTNMLTVYVTNCPELRRACFEAIQGVNTIGITNVLDFSGCNHLEEIRCADNRFPNIIITNGAGPELWHLCVHDNTLNQLPSNFNFTVFPSLQELWIWDNQFAGALAIPTATASNLTSVEAVNNSFTSMNFSGQTNLDHVYMGNNVGLTNVNISGCTKMRRFEADGCNLSQNMVDSVLSTLDSLGNNNTLTTNLEIALQGNVRPSVDGMRYVSNLVYKGWSVNINPPLSGTPEITGVNVTPSSNSVTITWKTVNAASDSTIFYGTSLTYNSSTNDSASVTDHSMTISGLTANTDYYFYIHSTASSLTGTTGDLRFKTFGGPAIYFVNTTTYVAMQSTVSNSPTLTWYWGNGTVNAGLTNVIRTMPTNSLNYLVVNPSSDLRLFGVQCQINYDVTLSSISGLNTYPNLNGIFFYLTALGNLSLAQCTNLTYAALVGCTNVTTTEANNWFYDLTNAQATVSQIGSIYSACGDSPNTFYCPANKADGGISIATNVLISKGWNIHFY